MAVPPDGEEAEEEAEGEEEEGEDDTPADETTPRVCMARCMLVSHVAMCCCFVAHLCVWLVGCLRVAAARWIPLRPLGPLTARRRAAATHAWPCREDAAAAAALILSLLLSALCSACVCVFLFSLFPVAISFLFFLPLPQLQLLG